MSSARIEVDGVVGVRRALRKVGVEAADLRKAHKEAAGLVADAAQVFVPRRSGRLAGTIRAAGQVGAGVVRAGRASVPYAGVIHFGWADRGIAPRPFLYDAADKRADEVRDLYAARLQSIARRSGL